MISPKLILPTLNLPAESKLHEIVTQKKVAVTERASAIPLGEFKARIEQSDRSFSQALMREGIALIAEIKQRSPSQGLLRPDFNLAEITQSYQRHAAAISVVTDEPFFGGNLELLRVIRDAVSLPVLLKDFVVSEYQIYEGRAMGADSVLLMASVLGVEDICHLMGVARELGMEPLVEVHTSVELDQILQTSAKIIGINNRNLKTLEVDPLNFLKLAPRIDNDRIRVCESGIKSKEDVIKIRGLATAALVGSQLMASSNIEAELQALGW